MEIKYTIKDEAKKHITEDDLKMIMAKVKNDPKNKHFKNVKIEIGIDEEDYLGFTYIHEPIKRVRRITGYLVGDVKSWNDAKRKELEERVKHK